MARISVNKLAEYLSATVIRRKAIIRDQKSPPDVIVARYRAAAGPVEAFFLSGGKDVQAIDKAIVKLRNNASGSPWALNDRRLTADALEQLLTMRDQLFAKGLTYAPAPPTPAKLVIAGVQVSIQPDLLVLDERRGVGCIGALRLHYIKAEDAMPPKAGEYVATLLHQWVIAHGPRGGRVPKADLCMSVDVFRRAIVTAPASQTKRMSEITAACEEIASRWDLL